MGRWDAAQAWVLGLPLLGRSAAERECWGWMQASGLVMLLEDVAGTWGWRENRRWPRVQPGLLSWLIAAAW